jgi:hypothetical protein
MRRPLRVGIVFYDADFVLRLCTAERRITAASGLSELKRRNFDV